MKIKCFGPFGHSFTKWVNLTWGKNGVYRMEEHMSGVYASIYQVRVCKDCGREEIRSSKG